MKEGAWHDGEGRRHGQQCTPGARLLGMDAQRAQQARALLLERVVLALQLGVRGAEALERRVDGGADFGGRVDGPHVDAGPEAASAGERRCLMEVG